MYEPTATPLQSASQAPRAASAAARGGAVAVIGLTALAALLRFSTLDVQSFWLDETVTADLMRRSFGGMLDALPDSESAPPLYYVVAWLWAKLWGTGEVGLRTLSAVFGTATVPVAYAAAARLATRRVGVIVAALVTVSPLLVWYSQEARVYSLLALLGALSFLGFVAAWRDPSARNVALWAIASALALLTHYFAIFLIAPEALVLFLAGRQRRQVVFALIGLAVVSAALLPLALYQRTRGGTAWIEDNALVERVGDTAVQFLIGPAAPAPAVVGPLAAVLAALGVWLLVTRGSDPERRAAKLAGGLGLAAVGAPLLLAVVGIDVFLQKNLIVAWLPLAIVPAIGFGTLAPSRVALPATGALCALGGATVIAVAVTPDLQRDDWREAAAAVDGSSSHRVLLVNPAFAGGLHDQAIQYYLPDAGPLRSAERTSEVDLLSLDDSGLDAQIRGVPELPEIPTPPGFRVAQRIEGERFTLIRFRADRERDVSAWADRVEAELDRADRGPSELLLIQEAGA
jgi:mannosyltransferase